jgi:hypothetical protein
LPRIDIIKQKEAQDKPGDHILRIKAGRSNKSMVPALLGIEIKQGEAIKHRDQTSSLCFTIYYQSENLKNLWHK